jgi:hypothetical protein
LVANTSIERQRQGSESGSGVFVANGTCEYSVVDLTKKRATPSVITIQDLKKTLSCLGLADIFTWLNSAKITFFKQKSKLLKTQKARKPQANLWDEGNE